MTEEILTVTLCFLTRNRMKNIIKIFFVVLLTLTFGSCTEKGTDDQNGNRLNEDLKLTVDVIKVEGLTATLRITSNGSDEDTWYGFATKETDAMKAYQQKILELTSTGKLVGLKNSPSFMTQAKGLEPYTDYNYIAFGINKDGEIYGAPAIAKFTSGLIETEDWEVSYNGKATINDVEYEHTIRAKSRNNQDKKYFITCAEKEYIDEVIAYYGGIEPLAEYYLEYMKYVIAESNKQSAGNEKQNISSVLFPDVVGGVVQDGIEAANIYPGDWYAIAIGVDPKAVTSTGLGRLSGEYSITSFNIPEEIATPEYASWIGKWTWTGANGVAWDVEFKKGFNNLWYNMSGWEGFGKNKNLDISVNWNKELKRWEIYSYTLGEFQFSEGVGYGFLTATYTVTEKGKEPVKSYLDMENGEGVLICYLEEDADGTFKCKGYTATAEDVTLKMDFMHYLAVFENKVRFMSNPEEGWPTFPITITPYGMNNDDDEFGALSYPVPVEKKNRAQIFTRCPKASGFVYNADLY